MSEKKKVVSKPLTEAEIKYVYRNDFYTTTSGIYWNSYDRALEYEEEMGEANEDTDN